MSEFKFKEVKTFEGFCMYNNKYANLTFTLHPGDWPCYKVLSENGELIFSIELDKGYIPGWFNIIEILKWPEGVSRQSIEQDVNYSIVEKFKSYFVDFAIENGK